MNRAERRRLDKQIDKQAKRGQIPLQLFPDVGGPIEVTPAKLAMIRREIADDMINRYGDKVAIEQARLDGYNEGHEDGEKFAQQHYLLLLYISCGLALDATYGFKARRISKVWHKIDEVLGEMLHILDDGLPIDEVEAMFNARLMTRTGMEFGLTHSTDDLRNNEGYNGGA